jgi:hypothetical protein
VNGGENDLSLVRISPLRFRSSHCVPSWRPAAWRLAEFDIAGLIDRALPSELLPGLRRESDALPSVAPERLDDVSSFVPVTEVSVPPAFYDLGSLSQPLGPETFGNPQGGPISLTEQPLGPPMAARDGMNPSAAEPGQEPGAEPGPLQGQQAGLNPQPNNPQANNPQANSGAPSLPPGFTAVWDAVSRSFVLWDPQGNRIGVFDPRTGMVLTTILGPNELPLHLTISLGQLLPALNGSMSSADWGQVIQNLLANAVSLTGFQAPQLPGQININGDLIGPDGKTQKQALAAASPLALLLFYKIAVELGLTFTPIAIVLKGGTYYFKDAAGKLIKLTDDQLQKLKAILPNLSGGKAIVGGLKFPNLANLKLPWGTCPAFGCDKAAAQINKIVGGTIHKIMPSSSSAKFLGPMGGQNPTWTYHVVVIKDGRVYDVYTGPAGLPIDQYKKLWDYADGILFGF